MPSFVPALLALLMQRGGAMLPKKLEDATGAYRMVVLLFVVLLRRTSSWPDERVKELQLRELRRLIVCARKRSRFWRERLRAAPRLRNLADLASLPLLRKADLVGTASEDVITGDAGELARAAANRTSGTSGQVVEVFFDPRQFYLTGAVYFFRPFLKRDASFFGLARLFRSVPWLVHRLAIRTNSLALVSREVPLPPAASEERLREIYRVLSTEPVFSVEALPSTLFQLAEFMRAEGLPPIARPLFIVAAGEELHPGQKKFLEETIGCTIRSFYAMREMLWLGWECERNPGRYHANAERVILEVVDGHGQTLPAGREGEIVITCLDNLFMPLIRYRTGDVGRIIAGGPCSCGKTLPLIEVHGRTMQFIRLPDGNTVSPLRLQPFLLEGEAADYVMQYQIRQVATDDLRVAVVLTRDGVRAQRLLAEIRRKTEALLGHQMRVVVEAAKNIPPTRGGKFREFVPLADAGDQNSTTISPETISPPNFAS